VRNFLSAFLLVVLAAPACAAFYTPPETILQDDVICHVHADGTYDYEESLTVRLNTAGAVEDFGQAYINFSGPPEDTHVLAAYSVTPDGTRLDVKPERILDQRDGGDGDDTFSDGNRKVIIFSGLAPGAVEHWHYVINGNGASLPGQFFDEEIFSADNATQAASVTVYAPTSYKLFFQSLGMSGGSVADDRRGEAKFFYTLWDAAAVSPEDGSVSSDDYSPRLEITSFASYPAVGVAYEARAADKSAVTPKVRALADKITAGMTAPRAKAAAIYDWVSHDIRYVAVDLGNSGYVPNKADEIIDAGYGDCKDHAALLKALLAAEGIPASNVLVAWSDAFFAPSVAMPGTFNHVITYIPGLNLFVDSTAQFAPFGVLPGLERGKQALITGAPGIAVRLVTLPLTSRVADVARSVTYETLHADGGITGATTAMDTGRYELSDREVFDAIDPGTEPDAAAGMIERFGELGSGTLSAGSAPDDLTRHFGYDASFTLPFYANLPGHGTMPLPAGVPMRHAIAMFPRNNALAARAEAMPCLADDITETSFLALPAGLDVKSLPDDVAFANGIGSYKAEYRLVGRRIEMDRHLVTHPAGPTCGPADYALLRDLSFAIGRDFRAAMTY
jgi:hypothetical protein